ncbi:MAG TPA: polyprenyl synthetase family protein [Geminicoccaceae bacterium]|nr:polyprenyl synthetase family protein [Geminicoccus sp.]HMU51319.1 polyprenyl synthetase family protein [Geminicoccaceae bacterium]
MLAERMAAVAVATEQELDRLLPVGDGPLGRLGQAMRYATLGGGKRFRPLLVAATADLGRAEPAAVTRIGAAIELVHAYSLIHDDLPAMDDATLRRGKPACHKAFGEAEAILAGDALLTLAFEVLARDDWPAGTAMRCEMALGLARAAGAAGMCGGQLLDLEGEGAEADADRIAFVEGLKTGAIIAFACDAGARLGGLDEAGRKAVAAYAADLGLAYQISDDLLDVEGDASITGKDSRLDVAADKATFVRAFGIAGAKRKLAELETHGSAQLDIWGRKSTLLRELFTFVINRRV